jgi:hypothetical protein
MATKCLAKSAGIGCLLGALSVLNPTLCAGEISIFFSAEPNGGYYYGTANNYPTVEAASEAAEQRCSTGGVRGVPKLCLALAISA